MRSTNLAQPRCILYTATVMITPKL